MRRRRDLRVWRGVGRADELDRFFRNTALYNQTWLPNPWYWPGNEPDLLVPFQFNVAGRADLTQKSVFWRGPSTQMPSRSFRSASAETLAAVYLPTNSVPSALFSASHCGVTARRYTRWVMQQYYTTAPDGVPGNDDYGTMSAW